MPSQSPIFILHGEKSSTHRALSLLEVSHLDSRYVLGSHADCILKNSSWLDEASPRGAIGEKRWLRDCPKKKWATWRI